MAELLANLFSFSNFTVNKYILTSSFMIHKLQCGVAQKAKMDTVWKKKDISLSDILGEKPTKLISLDFQI